MSDIFKVEFSPFKKLGIFNPEDESVSEAIESAYADYTSNVYFIFNEYKIELNRKADISDIYNDIIYIIDKIKSGDDTFVVNFLSSSFTAKRNIERCGTRIKISPTWFIINAFRNELLIDRKEHKSITDIIEVDINHFINEWSLLFFDIKTDLISLGYGSYLKKFEYLTLNS